MIVSLPSGAGRGLWLAGRLGLGKSISGVGLILGLSFPSFAVSGYRSQNGAGG